jgi:hypothetical protein
MRLQIEIPDDQVESIQAYLETQYRMEPDSLTGAARRRPMYQGVEDLILSQIATIIQGMVDLYPPESMRKKIEEVKRLQAEIKDGVKPKVVPTSG